ncbi:MAG: hypothetical protein ACYDGY_02085 [Acidimicrobiales bacterium]
MTTLVAYQRFIVLLRRMQYLAAVEAFVGLLAGFTVHSTAKTVIWVVTGVLVLWTFTTGFLMQKKYQWLLATSQAAQSEATINASSDDTSLDISLANDEQHDHSPELPVTQADSPENAAREAVRVAAMLSFERQFVRLALGSAAIAVVGVVWGSFLVGAARVVVIGCSVVGGFMLSGFFLLIKKRMCTGPKAEYLREGWKGYR